MDSFSSPPGVHTCSRHTGPCCPILAFFIPICWGSWVTPRWSPIPSSKQPAPKPALLQLPVRQRSWEHWIWRRKPSWRRCLDWKKCLLPILPLGDVEFGHSKRSQCRSTRLYERGMWGQGAELFGSWSGGRDWGESWVDGDVRYGMDYRGPQASDSTILGVYIIYVYATQPFKPWKLEDKFDFALFSWNHLGGAICAPSWCVWSSSKPCAHVVWGFHCWPTSDCWEQSGILREVGEIGAGVGLQGRREMTWDAQLNMDGSFWNGNTSNLSRMKGKYPCSLGKRKILVSSTRQVSIAQHPHHLTDLSVLAKAPKGLAIPFGVMKSSVQGTLALHVQKLWESNTAKRFTMK